MSEKVTNEVITIPEEHQEFCRRVARLAREHNLHDMRMQFNPRGSWPNQIEMSWTQGRHGADRNEMTLISTVNVHQDIDVPDSQRIDIINSDVQIEIIGPEGKVHYRRPSGHPDIDEAWNTPGYSIRKAQR